MSTVFTPTGQKLTIEDYHRLADIGVLNEDSRVELIEGELIEMAPVGAPHIWTVNRLVRLLVTAVGTRAFVSPQNPIVLPPYSEPQPDLTLVRAPVPGEPERTPGVNDVLLVVEVSDSTLSYDRGRKLRLYARMGITEFWIIDLQAKERRVLIYRDPDGEIYRTELRAGKGEHISPLAMPDVSLAVADIVA